MQKIFKKKKIYVWNNKPVRDFIFAEDAADAVVKLLNSKFTGVVNLGSGKSHSVKKLTNIFDIDIEIIHFPLHPDTPKEGKSLLDLFRTNQEDIDKKKSKYEKFNV